MNIDSVKLQEPAAQPILRREFRLTWRFVSFWTASVTVFGYVCFSLLLFSMTMRDGPQVSLADCFLYPWRRAEIRERQGAYLIEQGRLEVRLGHYGAAFPMLASGLSKNPADWQTRLYFAGLLTSIDARDSVRRLLDEGLGFSGNEPRYIDGVLSIAAHLQDHALRIKACEAGLVAARDLPDRVARLASLQEQKALALIALGRAADALAVLPEQGVQATAERVLLRSATLVQLKLPDEAVRCLSAWLQFRGNNPDILILLARALRQAGDVTGMEATLARARFAYPDDPRMQVELVANRAQAGNASGAAAALEKFFVISYGNPDNLIPMGRAMSQINEAGLLAACIDEANRLGYAGIGLRELMVELQAGRGEWAAAKSLLAEIAMRRANFNLPAGRWQVFYTRLVAAALQPDKVTQISFLELLREERPQAAALERVIRQLAQGGRESTAMEVATMAQNRYPELRNWSAYVRDFRAGPVADGLMKAPLKGPGIEASHGGS